MIQGRQLTSGGTIADRIEKRKEPKDIGELVNNLKEDWGVALEAYNEEKEETPTYPQMYAVMGVMVLIKEFREDLQKISDFLKKGEHAPTAEETQPETPKASAIPQGQEAPRERLITGPGSIPVKLSEDTDTSTQLRPSADARLTTPSPIVDIEPNAAQPHTPGKTQDDKTDPSKVIYRCRANHPFDEETAKAADFHCPRCRMLLRRSDEYDR